MKLISWNVNGLRACVQKGFLDFFQKEDADCFCLQETKLQADQLSLDLPSYHQYWNYAVKKGYSGTAVFSKIAPISVVNGIGVEELDTEGRVIAAEFEKLFILIVDFIYDIVHLIHMLFNFINKLELISCSDKVMLRIMSSEIYVTVNIVCEETDTTLKSHKHS